MDDFDLNVDIVHRVMAFSTRDTVSRVMRTCRTLNGEGARYLLCQDPYLTSVEQVTSFLLFLYAREQAPLTASRLYWLEGLSLGSYYDPDKERAFASTLKSFFTQFAPLARRLVRLNIDQDEGESLFSADPELALAISNLNTLRTVTITQAADHTMLML
ncbi:hypothetical protein C8T65DRAFT_289825 [Cerioporus squamosus]|nr:hypothetical protein C8T65DRAFT_289825 [Cerioporus squamosus]